MAESPIARPSKLVFVRRSLEPVRFEIHPVTAGIIGILCIMLMGWSAATTTYALFRDEVLLDLSARHAAIEKTSKVEIARLKAEIERAASRHLVETTQFQTKLETLSRRQATIEKRQNVLASLAATLPTKSASADDAPGAVAKPRDLSDISKSYDQIEQGQDAIVTALESRIEQERKTLGGVYTALGLTSTIKPPVRAAMGGPYIPFGLGASNDDLSDRVARLRDVAVDRDRLRAGLDDIPVRNPSPGAEVSSNFGSRTDPFLGAQAFHAGVDLRARAGTPVFATAGGTVVSAGWNGGYGNMVEVSHSNGLSTRYGHLSAISVAAGEKILPGTIIGRVGTTGRSTGPHLHYEVRNDDRAVNPQRFLAAGAALGG